MIHPFLNLDDVPTPEKDPEFWTLITNPNFKTTINYLILNEIRKYNPEQLSADACRVQLAKLKAWEELLDFPNALISAGEKETLNDEPDLD